MAENDNNSDRRPWWQSIAPDLLALAGGGSLSYGCWLIYPPLAFLAGGVILIAMAMLMARGG